MEKVRKIERVQDDDAIVHLIEKIQISVNRMSVDGYDLIADFILLPVELGVLICRTYLE